MTISPTRTPGDLGNLSMSMLRQEMSQLGSMLGEIVSQVAGDAALSTIENLRELAFNRRQGDAAAESEMVATIADLDDEQLRIVIRAFTVFLDLSNLAEDRERIRVLRSRAAQRRPAPPADSAAAAIDHLATAGIAAAEVQRLLNRVCVELVFTAHPTDAKRRSIRNKYQQLRSLLDDRDAKSRDPDDSSTAAIDEQIRIEILKVWQTNFIRPWRPSVMQEVRRGLSIKPVLWQVAPQVIGDIRNRLQHHFGDRIGIPGNALSFGSWIGGDRDGHPGVTAAVTCETFSWLREAALEMHIATCNTLFGSLSFSNRQIEFPPTLETKVQQFVQRDERLADLISGLPPGEICRRFLAMVGQRLAHTAAVRLDSDDPPPPLAYQSPAELRVDAVQLRDAIAAGPNHTSAAGEVQDWIDRIDMFGFHLAKLDVRQDARVYREVVAEIRKQMQPHSAADDSDDARLEWLTAAIDSTTQPAPPMTFDETGLSEVATDTLALFRLLRRVAAASGSLAIGSHVISMTASAADVMTVQWFWQLAGQGMPHESELAIVPLLETIEDLQNGPAILNTMFATPAYRKHLTQFGDRQTVMLGYSDSTKDGGYLSACWSLHQSQQSLTRAADELGVHLTFFHGRGGSLGRGGGPAARGIASLPSGAFDGTMRLTEQGEVLADRYDDPAIARRHLDQVMGAVIRRAGLPPAADDRDWTAAMEKMSSVSLTAYRKLIESPGFVRFFRLVTPIGEIEQLPIGSRPARRRGGEKLTDLRAIPWVFSWTQSRCLIPAWYGLGSGLAVASDEGQAGWALLKTMYHDWPFFTAVIDNAELALAKSDMRIAGLYASLAERSDEHREIADAVESEFIRSRSNVLRITGGRELLEGTPWLRESIRVRNRYIDPLNLIQVEMLRRGQSAAADEAEEIAAERRHLTRLTINGIAAGLRTSG